jgi:hypothetical protein
LETLILQNYFERRELADNNKLTIALKCIEWAKQAGIKARTVGCDAWYFVDWFVITVLLIPDIERVISRMKKNHPIIYNGKIINAGELFKQAPQISGTCTPPADYALFPKLSNSFRIGSAAICGQNCRHFPRITAKTQYI